MDLLETVPKSTLLAILALAESIDWFRYKKFVPVDDIVTCPSEDKYLYAIGSQVSGQVQDWPLRVIDSFVGILQNVVSVILVYLIQATGAITTEPITWRLIKVWFPVNCLFVGMLVTSTYR